MRRAALYTACGFIGHRHGGDIARFCERNLKETYDRVVSTGRLIKVRYVDPSVSSSLPFLRKTPWAREKVEGLYLATLRAQRRASPRK